MRKKTSSEFLLYPNQKADTEIIHLFQSKNSTCREQIQNGSVNLPQFGHTVLSKDLIVDCSKLSDMFGLNEYKALALLCTAHEQKPLHSDQSHVLIAIILYLDGQKALIAALRQLFQARHSISWCSEASKHITDYTNALVDGGLLDKVIDLLATFDKTHQMTLLNENRGSSKYNRQILDLFEEIRVELATALCCWASQNGLPQCTTLKLIHYLAKYAPDNHHDEIHDETLALIIALMYAFDDPAYIQDVHTALTTVVWQSNGLRSVAMLSFELKIATLPTASHPLQQQIASDLESAIEENVFDYIYHVLLEKNSIFNTEFYYRRIHSLLIEFIEFWHPEMTEWRGRTDGCLDQHFEMLFLTIGKFYGKDKYWRANETGDNLTHRSEALFKFIRLVGELLSPNLLASYLKMLAGLSSSEQSARSAFNFLYDGISNASGSLVVSWEYFFGAMSQYNA